MPHKVWQVGEEVIAPDFNTYVQQQVVEQFPNVAARTAAVTAPVAGQPSYIDSGDANEGIEFYNGAAWRKPWNLPWGLIGQNIVTADQTGIAASIVDLTGLALTFTAVANRAYRATWLFQVLNGANAATFSPRLSIDGSESVMPAHTINIGWSWAAAGWCTFGLAAGSRVVKLRGSINSGSCSIVNATAAGRFVVEDIGPGGAPS
jgi:hypothetical protein